MKIWELEWKKINKKPFLRGIIGLAAFSLSIAMLFLFIPDEEMGRGDAMIIREWESLIVLVSCVTLFGFAVLGAVIYVNAVFKEYQGKRSLLLFSYPIERKRMFRAKACLSGISIMAAAFIVNYLVLLVAGLTSNVFHIMPHSFGLKEMVELVAYSLAMAVLASGIGLIALGIGMFRSSAMTVVIATLIIAGVMTNLFSANMFTRIGIAIALVLVLAAGCVAFHQMEVRIKNMEVR